MRKSFTVSNLTIAAVVLLVSSIPCLAQATANESQSVLTVAANRPAWELGRKSHAASSSLGESPVTSRNVEPAESPLNLSSATFKMSDSRVSDPFGMGSKYFSEWQLGNELAPPDSKLRSDDDTPTSRRRVTFVPSRGLRMPN